MTELLTLVTGPITKLVGKVNLFMLKVIYMMENGIWTELVAMVYINIMVHCIKVNGRMINNMDMVMKNG